jgi:hypothetical protein
MIERQDVEIIERSNNMKPATTVVTILLVGISAAHLVRIISRVDIAVNGMQVPIWVSIFGVIVPAVLALLLWRENRRR